MALEQPYYPEGAFEFRSSGVLSTSFPETTQQLACDWANVPDMRAATGNFQQDAPPQ